MTIPDADSFVTTHPHTFQGHSDRCTWTFAIGGVSCGAVLTAHRWPCSATCTHNDAWTPGHPERVQERSEALSEGLKAYDEAHQDYQFQQSEEYQSGAEAMRAACLRDVVALLESTGLRDHGSDSIIQRVKAAIEGATP